MRYDTVSFWLISDNYTYTSSLEWYLRARRIRIPTYRYPRLLIKIPFYIFTFNILIYVHFFFFFFVWEWKNFYINNFKWPRQVTHYKCKRDYIFCRKLICSSEDASKKLLSVMHFFFYTYFRVLFSPIFTQVYLFSHKERDKCQCLCVTQFWTFSKITIYI